MGIIRLNKSNFKNRQEWRNNVTEMKADIGLGDKNKRLHTFCAKLGDYLTTKRPPLNVADMPVAKIIPFKDVI